MLKSVRLFIVLGMLLSLSMPASAAMMDNPVATGLGVAFGAAATTMAALSGWYASKTKSDIENGPGFKGDKTGKQSAYAGEVAGYLTAGLFGAGTLVGWMGGAGAVGAVCMGAIGYLSAIAALVGDSIAYGVINTNSDIDITNARIATGLSAGMLVTALIYVAAYGSLAGIKSARSSIHSPS